MVDALVHGVLLGGVYAAVALGLSLIFGVMNILNLAHGGFIVLGSYGIWVLQVYLGIDPLIAVLVTAVAAFGLGYALYRWGGVWHVSKGPVFMAIVLTFGFNLIMVSGIEFLFSNDSQNIEVNRFLEKEIVLFGARFSLAQLLIAVVSLLITLSVHRWIMHTKTGRAIRAVRQNLEVAALNGVNVRQTNAIAFAVGTALAALAGAFLAFIGPFSPHIGESYLTTAFAVAIIGGLGNIQSVIAAGFLYGIVLDVSSYLFGTVYGAVITLFILLVILLIRPQGLFGTEYY